ncbi:type IV secretion system protein (plasmid) [Guyparkeria sp. 1SP6A2]|nr:type IV secretion system protein [Guyparkeria sp. 1SP6A2]
MAVTLYEDLFRSVDTALGRFALDTVREVVAFIDPIFFSLVTLSVVIWGILLAMGKADAPLQDSFFRIIKITFIVTFALRVGMYSGEIMPFLMEGPEHFAGVITGSTSTTAAQALDNFLNEVIDLVEALWEEGGITGVGMYLLAILMAVLGGAVSLYMAFLILLAKIMTALLMGLGPVFIIMILFPATQRFFEGWLSMVLNHGIILILATGLSLIMIALAQGMVDQLTGGNAASAANLTDALMLGLVFGMSILILRQVPSAAMALAGGVSLETSRAFGKVMGAGAKGSGRAARGAGRATAAATKTAGARTANLAKKTWTRNGIGRK